jgi:tRNA(fMet)-specific endonuclease VapC
MSFLVDTDICSAYLRGDSSLFNRFLQFAGNLHVSTIVVGELYTWAFRKAAPPKRIHAIESFLGDVMILDYDRQVAAIRATSRTIAR